MTESAEHAIPWVLKNRFLRHPLPGHELRIIGDKDQCFLRRIGQIMRAAKHDAGILEQP